MCNDSFFMKIAINEAKISFKEGGIPIGAVLVKNNKIISKGHNKLIQNGSVILHAEMDAIENAGRLSGEDYKEITLFTTLSPCPMCSGAILLYNISRVVIGENKSLMGAEDLLRKNGVKVDVLNILECQNLLLNYIKNNQLQWDNELEKVSNSTNIF